MSVVTASYDQILRAARQNQPLIIGQITDVAGIEPTILASNALIVLGVDVSRKHLRSFDEH